MQRRKALIFVTAGLFSALVACQSPEGPAKTTLTVSAAASLQEVLAAISAQFTTIYPDIAIDYNFGSSGALQRQIEQGAPVDVFFSAATTQMNTLEKQGLIVTHSRQDIISNQLVLVGPPGSPLVISNMAQLQDLKVSRIAVGEFRSVPAGQYAQQVFKQLNLLDPLMSKFVFSNNVRSVLGAVENGHVDLGLVYATDAALVRTIEVFTTVPTNLHAPIVYPIATVQTSAHPEAAQEFITFLTTAAAQVIFEQFGFNPLPPLSGHLS